MYLSPSQPTRTDEHMLDRIDSTLTFCACHGTLLVAVAKTLHHRSETSGKNDQNEYATFESALKSVLSVSHSQLKSKLDAAKRKKAKKSSASHGVNGKG
jgi:uncharacterized membrane protein